MNRIDPPDESQPFGRPADDLDGLLRTFFRAQMPHPWPGLELPGTPARFGAHNGRSPSANGTAPRSSPRQPQGFLSSPRFRSRLTLAASVGLLLLGTLLLSGKFHLNSSDESSFGQPAADLKVRESILIPFEEQPGPDGKPIRVEQPALYRMDLYP